MQSKTIAPIHFAMQSELHPGLHVAIIMDGNGRWATQRGLPRALGHRAGAESARRVIEHAADSPGLGIVCITLYAFSSGNWQRPPLEVQGIFWLLRGYLRLERQRLKRRGVRLEVIGRRDRLPTPVLREIERTESATASGRSLHVRVAVDYSSREAIARAAILADWHSRQNPADPPSNRLAHELGGDSVDVDLLIRTGGEKRLSDFLLWESAYAELLFLDCLWPDFTPMDLESALQQFHHRERRFGAIPTPAETLAEAL